MKRDMFFWICVACGVVILAFILIPFVQLLIAPAPEMMKKTIMDGDVRAALRVSLSTAGAAALISLVFGTPLAFFLARNNFKGKKFIESVIDLPIVIPHPVVGIAILSVTGREHWIGRILGDLGVRILGSHVGIIVVLTFVGMPFYINAAKHGFEAISPRIEYVSRSLGASMIGTFFRVTFPLAFRSMLMGVIMCLARAISEFGAVVIVAYHPMNAPVMIYERFEAYGLAYSLPISVWLLLISLAIFLVFRMLSMNVKGAA